MTNKKGVWLLMGVICFVILGLLGMLQKGLNPQQRREQEGIYETLPPDTNRENPLLHISEDFIADEQFSTNLPIVILSLDAEPAKYKSFKTGEEVVDETVDPYVGGYISVIDSGSGINYLTDAPMAESYIRIKMRGHTSIAFDKLQYLVKTVTQDELENSVDLLGMGEGHEWILNGSLADKSMMRNYLSYRIASEIGGGAMAPDSRYCEVFITTEEGYKYQGVYLLMETVSRGENRVNIDQFNPKNSFTSYIVRRDRYTSFDVMLDTNRRLNGLSQEWIGVKYPSAKKLTDSAKQFIEADFSHIEQVIYADSADRFKSYDKYIDVDSFVDYFLINEFFGNYDAGEHSTYMYKNSGGKLYIGPVWDFDQAMNNYFQDEMENDTLAFQVKPFYERLCLDERFITNLKKRYSELRDGPLSEEHIFEVMDETKAYLRSAQVREWYRWAADYEDDTFLNAGNYYLLDYEKDGVTLSRFNDKYEQELYNIRMYLHKHGNAIQTELTKLYDLAEYNSSLKSSNGLFLLAFFILFLAPSLLINRRG